jgi:hypothetical protein
MLIKQNISKFWSKAAAITSCSAPARFGKTLFLSTLRHYYDIRCKDEFKPLFGKLSIGRNPTPLKNSYQILSFDFSGIETGSQEDIRRGFNRKVETALKKFLRRYGYSPETEQIIEKQNSPAGKLDYFFTTTEDAHIYLLISNSRSDDNIIK